MATTYDKASLVMIPSGYKDDKLYSVKPTDGSGDFTFSRDGAGASPATRVNASGLIEKGRENVLLQSNNFGTTWTASSASVTSGQSGYDGTSDAWLLSKSGENGQVNQSVSTSGVNTFSCYAKAGTSNWLRLTPFDDVFFDLANGVSYEYGATTITSSIESVGGGWYRCSITYNATSTLVRIIVADSSSSSSGTSGNIYIQDAQLESGLVATDYIETTTAPVSAGLLGDMPRLDYSGGATCPSLLLEPSRVNIIPHSEYINSSTYTDVNWTGTYTNNTSETLSPEGKYNAVKFVKSGATDRIYYQTSQSDGTYTGSIYFKAVSGQEGNTIEISVRRFGGGTGSTTKVITLTSEWQRVDVTATLAGGTNTAFYIADFSSAGTASSFYAYGAQLEVGSYPTSYIPTYGTAAPRGADSCVNTSASAIIGQTEGTLFVDYNSNITSDDSFFIVADDGTANNRIVLYSNVPNNLALVISTGGVLQSIIPNIPLASGTNKFAVGYANNDVVLYLNGTQVGSDNTASIPATSALRMATDHTNTDYASGKGTKQALVFKTRLTNAELASLTTL